MQVAVNRSDTWNWGHACKIASLCEGTTTIMTFNDIKDAMSLMSLLSLSF